MAATSNNPGDLHGEWDLLAGVQRRLAQFDAHVYPLCGNELLLSRTGGFTLTVPDLRAAFAILRQWEAQ